MTLHSSTRVPVDDSYVSLVGKAVWVFAYYEGTIIFIIDRLKPGFVLRYFRGAPMTSGAVRKQLQGTLDDPAVSFVKVPKAELQDCCDEFERHTMTRNALIHAHPITAPDGSQILAYQTKLSKELPDLRWPRAAVEEAIRAFDMAAITAARLFDRLRS